MIPIIEWYQEQCKLKQWMEATGMVEEAGAIVLREGKILLVRSNKKPHPWFFPKGHIEESLKETPEECAIRECEEETGVVVYVRRKLGDLSFEREGADYRVQYYLCTYAGEIKAKEERKSFWCPLEHAINILTIPNAADLVFEAMKASSEEGT